MENENATEITEIPEEIVEEITVKPDTPIGMTHSETLGNIAGALALAQGLMLAVKKDAEGYGYNFADLASVIGTIKKPLSDNGIAYTQSHFVKRASSGGIVVVTDSMLMHSSGEWIKGSLELPLPKMKQLQPAQLVGVVATYARRYLLQAQVGLAAEDKDGAVK